MGFLTTGIYSHFLAIFATNSQVHTVFNTRAKSIYHFDKIHQAGRHVSLVTGAAADYCAEGQLHATLPEILRYDGGIFGL